MSVRLSAPSLATPWHGSGTTRREAGQRGWPERQYPTSSSSTSSGRSSLAQHRASSYRRGGPLVASATGRLREGSARLMGWTMVASCCLDLAAAIGGRTPRLLQEVNKTTHASMARGFAYFLVYSNGEIYTPGPAHDQCVLTCLSSPATMRPPLGLRFVERRSHCWAPACSRYEATPGFHVSLAKLPLLGFLAFPCE